MSRPIVIAVTGQSNAVITPSYSWTPPSNLHLWNWDGDIAHIGTAFAAPDGTTMGLAQGAGKAIANACPGRDVYIVNIGLSGEPIADWLPNATTDIYAALKANLEAALSLLGLDTIDGLIWWQGESNTGSLTYVSDLLAVHARLRGESWFPYMTPFITMGISPYAGTDFANFNTNFEAFVSLDPDARMYVHTGALPTSFWNMNQPFAGVHMLGPGFEQAGFMAGYRWLGGPQRGALYGNAIDPVSGSINAPGGILSIRCARFKANKNGTDQTNLTGTFKVTWPHEEWDEGSITGYFGANRWTPPGRIIHLHSAFWIANMQTAKAMIYKNSALFQSGPVVAGIGNYAGNFATVYAEDTPSPGDYYEIWCQVTPVNGQTAAISGQNISTFFCGTAYA